MKAKRLAVGIGALMFGVACSAGGGSTGSSAKTFVDIHGLAVDASGILYVATHRGLIRSSGDHTSWTYAGPSRDDHMGFSLDPRDGAMFRSGHPEAGGSLGVEGSSDGMTWQHLADVAEPPVDFHAMAVSYADGRLYGFDSGGRGLFTSSDDGRAWTSVRAADVPQQIFALAAPATTGMVYAGTDAGLMRSADGGRTWTRAGLGGGFVSAVACDPKDPAHLLAFAETGMMMSRDGAKTWSAASQGLPERVPIVAIAISPKDPDVAYAAAGTSVFQTTDGARTWRQIRAGP